MSRRGKVASHEGQAASTSGVEHFMLVAETLISGAWQVLVVETVWVRLVGIKVACLLVVGVPGFVVQLIANVARDIKFLSVQCLWAVACVNVRLPFRR